ncbi:MAG: translational GTPase TypA [Alphaproteobacteria bacterium TMED87]|nr:translational GTPase TypA [Rhodospirillaceae bacterium]OUV10806.1 MAG: translational GTPase TypA [Alphaproteobacteria bacterium TMED87]
MLIRNIAIIAHVDHGKTTLVDSMFRQSGAVLDHQRIEERAMDSGDIERERGITILAKCTSIVWNKIKINIVDTPGHADFGGEVERILSMVDGAVLLVDSAEGPLPQTKFVTSKALELGLEPIVIINKIDRSDARPLEVLDEVFDLFDALGANERQLDFPILYAVGRDGWAVKNLEEKPDSLSPLFNTIIDHVKPPDGDSRKNFSMLATTLESDPYLGRVLTGRINSGVVKTNMMVKVLDSLGEKIENARVSKLLTFKGLERSPISEACAGDIVAIAGLENATVSHTICHPDVITPIESRPIDPPTLAMTFSVNDSPLAGLDGSKVTSRQIGERLFREAESNIAIKITQSTDHDSFEVAGRGELQLSVLIETMRREGYELSVSMPRVLYRKSDSGKKEEPIESVVIDLDEEFCGIVVESMSKRKADLLELKPSGGSRMKVIFSAPSRGLIGYHSKFLTETRGTGIMNRLYSGYSEYKGNIETRRNGVLISNSDGASVAYALYNLLDRGEQFIGSGVKVYRGMIIGEHTRDNDLEVNPLKSKQLTNIRAAGKDDAIKLPPTKVMTLEQSLSYIQSDELVEVTPKYIRLRKRFLDPNIRKRTAKKNDSEV